MNSSELHTGAKPPRSHRHVDDCDLVEYASGSCPELLSLLIATHLTFCESCRDTVSVLEAVGGTLLDVSVDSTSVSASEASSVVEIMVDTLDRLQNGEYAQEPAGSALDGDTQTDSAVSTVSDTIDIDEFPLVLQRYLVRNFDTNKWKRLLAGVESWQLIDDGSGLNASLMRVEAGRVMPRHTHEGRELTLILDGTMCDRDVVYERGDVVEADATVKHQPRAGTGAACLCLAVVEGDIILSNPVSRILARLLPSAS